LKGLAFIHDSGVIHLDLKPSNIFMTEDGRFKIGDFGMATLWPRPDETTFEREGDKMYLAPEVLQGVYSQAADVFRYVSILTQLKIKRFNAYFSLGMTMLETASNIVVPDQCVCRITVDVRMLIDPFSEENHGIVCGRRISVKSTWRIDPSCSR
jgi:mitosis inhibitor protein kinase SWE1